ncbi:uncharacterized protein DUF4214 [Pseudoduganella flava]|uniref:DUF4214 domain-containing protein n=1 Tax=Pseudoduganella flava TaxID=871742 RepID=A0A562PVC7_9BURK|nr:DUF4214 domain-containing protein [Pseudoduganella flava]QGZ39520.1 DUF4214 domain-containing protein [Pseudoduganella flava]TWI48412.1 uncharacterized protein DUF4214 [Pseudoduganella flava]
MATTAAQIQQLYVAYFNRPADYFGLSHWQAIADTQGLAYVANEFSKQPEYTNLYAGKSQADVVDTIYMNLFGRHAEAAGLVHWVTLLNNGTWNLGQIALAIAQGAQNEDLTAVNNKVDAARVFTENLANSAEGIRGYDGAAANQVAKDWLSTITDNTSHDAAITSAALATLVANVVDAHDAGTNIGQTFTTSVGLDTLTGTTAKDTFNVVSVNPTNGDKADTLSSIDVLDGGAGVDTLNFFATADNNKTIVGTIKNIEIVNLYGAENISAAKIDATKFAGSTTINVVDAQAAVEVDGLAGKTLGVGAAVATATKITGDFGSTATSAAVALNGVVDGASVEVVGAKVAALNVSGSVAAAAAGGAGTVTLANTTATKLNLNVSSKAIVEVAGLTALTTITQTGAGGLDLTDAGTSVQTINTGAGADKVKISFATAKATSTAAAKNATVATGAGNDKITVATTGTGLTTVDAGLGDDTIDVTITAGNALNVSGGAGNDTIKLSGAALAVTDVIDGGEGTDTIALAGKLTERNTDDFIVLNKVLKGFESIEFTTAEGTVGGGATAEIALDASKLAAAYTTLTFADGSFVKGVGTQNLIANGDLTATAAGYIAKNGGSVTTTTYAGTLNVSTEAAGTIEARADTVKLAVTAADTDDKGSAQNVAVTLAGDTKTAIVTLAAGVDTDADGVAAHDNVATLTLVADSGSVSAIGKTTQFTENGALTSLTLTGAGSADIKNVAGKLTTIDTSGLAGTYTVTADGHTKGDAFAGLKYETSNTAVETIKLGAGIDALTFNAGSSTYGSVDTVSGLNLVLDATDNTKLAANSDTISLGVTGFEKATSSLTDFDLALKQVIEGHAGKNVVFAFGGDTYIVSDVGSVGQVDAADAIVKLVGTVNLDTLVIALG